LTYEKGVLVMIGPLRARLKQGRHTAAYPLEPPKLPERFRGLPRIDADKCAKDCASCVEACPVNAAARNLGKPTFDLGRCVFCGACAEACSEHAIEFTQEWRMAARKRGDLILDDPFILKRADELDAAMRRVFGRSLSLRQVSAGGCNACEADVNVLNTLVYDLSRFGVHFAASPRHADGILVTGPVPRNMELALKKTYDAIPAPKFVIAVGACAISGGMFAGHDEVACGAAEIIPVDLYIPGCPPHPYTILDGLLRLLGRIA
jgi:Ni,Fe-hydrogenase III small subunit/Pyruvate/2-oxoacid:ferredoxin oxidoreductase delta subunit